MDLRSSVNFISTRPGAFSLLLALFILGLGSAAVAQTPPKPITATITLGIVAETHQKEIEERFRDFVRYVARKISPATALEGKVVVTATVPELAKLLDQGTVDFYMESPYPTYVVNNVHGAGTLLLRRWKSGMADYRSLIFTHRNSGIQRLDGLRGKMLVFEDPESSSGYFLPKLFLQRNGFKLTEKPALDANVGAAEVGFVFARTQENLVDLVLTKRVAAGAFSNDDHAALDEKKRNDILVLAQTELLPRHLLSVRKDMPLGLVGRLEKTLLAMHEDAEGRKILQNTDATTKFDPLPGGEAVMRRRLLDSFYSPERK
ncbi:MAG: phosphate/phosphite/phosphonate ABC transporter substrate-binding protein [Deltaproteobacteria bacterium]|nr:phosphate/phosphite/phosphonate ABC transporter substrate-binding protein [Deltaproteobacteria bacterium]